MTEPLPGDLRRAELKKLAEAALHCRDRSWYFGAVNFALREARDVASQDAPYRQEKLGFCMGVNQTLAHFERSTSLGAYRDALDAAQLMLAAETSGQVLAMREQINMVILRLKAED